MSVPISPYHAPGFYEQALAKGKHRDIVGGRWEETGRAQMAILMAAGLRPQHHLLDIGAGSLRLGCKAVPYLSPGHYWATDKSRDLMLRGHEAELADRARLPQDHLIEDQDFDFPGVPPTITHVMAFAVFTHLPLSHLARALDQIARRCVRLERLLFTVFLAESGAGSLRQRDGVVTHPGRAPYHFSRTDVLDVADAAGFRLSEQPTRLPRGQVMFSGGHVGQDVDM